MLEIADREIEEVGQPAVAIAADEVAGAGRGFGGGRTR